MLFDFSDGQLPAGWETPADADAGWSISTDTESGSGYCIASDDVDDGERAGIACTAVFDAGELQFRARVSSEDGYDFLYPAVDGEVVEAAAVSGDVGWATYSVWLTAGQHTIEFVYEKDGSVSEGSDRAWIDWVEMPLSNRRLARHAVEWDVRDWVAITARLDAQWALAEAPTPPNFAARALCLWAGLPLRAWRSAAAWASPQPVLARHAGAWAVPSATAIVARHAARWSSPDPAPVILAPDTRLWHQGRAVELVGAVEISCDEGSPSWICSPTLADAADYARIQLGDALTLELGGAEWALICDGRRYSDSGTGPEYTLSLISPVALAGEPWALPVTVATSGLARDHVEDLLGMVDWRLVDWAIPAAALSAEGTPLALARSIVAAVGGVLESLPDGSLRARRAHPVSPPDYASAPATGLTDRDLLGAAEEADAVEIWDRFTVTSGSAIDASAEVQVESRTVEGDPHAFDVRAYPYPFRPVSLAHTGDAATEIGVRQSIYEVREELIELRAGAGSVAYPVETLLGVRYQYRALGAVSASGRELTAAVSDYSLAWVQYRTTGYQWRVTNARVETIQFLAMEAS